MTTDIDGDRQKRKGGDDDGEARIGNGRRLGRRQKSDADHRQRDARVAEDEVGRDSFGAGVSGCDRVDELQAAAIAERRRGTADSGTDQQERQGRGVARNDEKRERRDEQCELS